MTNTFFAGIPLEGSGLRPLDADLYSTEQHGLDHENISATGNLNIGVVMNYDEHAQRHLSGGIAGFEDGRHISPDSGYIGASGVYPANNNGREPFANNYAGDSTISQSPASSSAAFTPPSAAAANAQRADNFFNAPVANAATSNAGGTSSSSSSSVSNSSTSSTSAATGGNTSNETTNNYNQYNSSVTNITNEQNNYTQNNYQNNYNDGDHSIHINAPHLDIVDINVGNITIGGNGGGSDMAANFIAVDYLVTSHLVGFRFPVKEQRNKHYHERHGTNADRGAVAYKKTVLRAYHRSLPVR